MCHFPAMLQFGDLRTLRPEDPRILPDSNGSIIAVSYEARAHGVKRYDTGTLGPVKGEHPQVDVPCSPPPLASPYTHRFAIWFPNLRPTPFCCNGVSHAKALLCNCLLQQRHQQCHSTLFSSTPFAEPLWGVGPPRASTVVSHGFSRGPPATAKHSTD
jgi:hypothetical protein